jgi:hypothetical protein
VRGADDRDPRRVEPVLGQPRPVKVALLEAPQHGPFVEAPGDAGDKPRGGGAILLIGSGAEDFMHRAERQPAIRQDLIDRRDSKRQHSVTRRAIPLDAADALLQSGETGGR